MSEFNEANLEQLIVACQGNSTAIAESLNGCFEREYRIEVGDSLPWDADKLPSEFDTAGLLVAVELGSQAMICLVPASLPLPDWYTSPSESEQSRLQRLAQEWSINLLPADLEAGKFAVVAVENLKHEVTKCQPVESAASLELLLFDNSADDAGTKSDAAEASADDGSAESEDTRDGTDSSTADTESTSETPESSRSGEAVAKLYLIWPVTKGLFPSADAVEATAKAPAAAVAVPPTSEQSVPPRSQQAKQLMSLPVAVIVHLAEKKIEMDQLLSLTPGALITFDKSCEDLLDLYVNNYRYCRGEAVKIGEKFGLKINEVGVVETRAKRIL